MLREDSINVHLDSALSAAENLFCKADAVAYGAGRFDANVCRITLNAKKTANGYEGQVLVNGKLWMNADHFVTEGEALSWAKSWAPKVREDFKQAAQYNSAADGTFDRIYDLDIKEARDQIKRIKKARPDIRPDHPDLQVLEKRIKMLQAEKRSRQ